MLRPRLRTQLATLVALSLIGGTEGQADGPARPPIPRAADGEGNTKPIPPVAIPDDPPPHEGALIDIPLIIEPPDILVVEVLEGLPGQPITGEHLVRPDGTISLGFYGDVHVRGLTPTQAKVKIILHLREFLIDETLGIVKPMDGDRKPGEARPDPDKLPGPTPEGSVPAEKKPEADSKIPKTPGQARESSIDRKTRASRNRQGRGPRVRATRRAQVSHPGPDQQPASTTQDTKPEAGEAQAPSDPVAESFRKLPLNHRFGEGQFQLIAPADSTRVFVDITSHNSKTYFVQGEVGVPGRLPITGKETVLDALNYAGGLVPNAEPADIHLYRPARGGKPSKDYKIDLAAILKGDAKANLQVFPADRLSVGRNPIVEKTVQIDRAAGLVNSVLNTILQYSFTARSLAVINTPTGGSTAGPAKVGGPDVPNNPVDPSTLLSAGRRDAMLKDWADFLWSISSKEGGAMLDEKAFREALMKKLSSTPVPELKQ